MLKQFYEKALPTQGTYCVTGIDPNTNKVQNKFAESIDDVIKHIEVFNSKKVNTYVALGSFDGYSRLGKDCLYFRSLFIDLDVSDEKAKLGKGYSNKTEALLALDKFLTDSELPPPVVIDSGTGVHTYWLLEEDVPVAEYMPYAEKFKSYVMERLYADPTVMAEPSRIMRCPDSFNYKTTPPSPAGFISEEINEYSFDAFKEFLGEIEQPSTSVLDLLPKGLDDETRQMLKLDNFEASFEKILSRSMVEGTGCAQIKYAIDNAEHLPEPIWYSAMTVAAHCADKEMGVHELSRGYVGYEPKIVEEKLKYIIGIKDGGPRTCSTFNEENPGVCDGCQHRGKIKSPIQLGKVLAVARPAKEKDEAHSVRKQENPKKIPEFPEFLAPFCQGINGGIYYQPAAAFDKKTNKYIPQDAIEVSKYDFYPYRRLFSPHDGECFMIRLLLPNDAPREFLLPMKAVYAQEKFKEIMTSNGLFFKPDSIKYVTEYIVKWGQYLVSSGKAEIMRMQMGWVDDGKVFVLGNREITAESGPEGDPTPISPAASNITRALVPKGNLELWKRAASGLNEPSMEMHAFGMLCGFGSPLMEFASTDGVAVCFEGKSGAAKTGALYAGLSIWGDPKKMSIFEATDNAMQGRLLTCKNVLVGIDEAGDKDPKVLSTYIHRLAQGSSKLRLSGTSFAERSQELNSSTIGVFTTNHSLLGIIKTKKSTPYGEAARMFETYMHAPQLLKDKPEKGKEIFDTFRTNYGHAGPVFITKVYEWGTHKVMNRMDFWAKRFQEDFGHIAAYRFYEDLIATTFTGGEIAKEAELIDLDIERVYHKVVMEMIIVRDGTIKINDTDYIAILGEFLLEQQGSTLGILNEKVVREPSPHRKLCVRADGDTETVYISTEAFEKYLATINASVKDFVFYMKEKGILIMHEVTEKGIKKTSNRGRMRLAAGWKGATGAYNVNVYAFKYNPPEELLKPLADDEHPPEGT